VKRETREDRPVTAPLNTFISDADGRGSATTAAEDVTPTELLGTDEGRFIVLHPCTKIEQRKEIPPDTACADLVQTIGPDVQSSALPESHELHLETLHRIGAPLVEATLAGSLGCGSPVDAPRSSTALQSKLGGECGGGERR
jgi:hypothetical protein